MSKSAASELTPRWTPATLSAVQRGYLFSKARINVVVAGRRSFKTEGAKRRLVLGALRFHAYPDGRFFACAPTHQQAKDIFWEDLKKLVPPWALRGGARRAISDSELSISLVNGAVIRVAGLDRPARIEGKDWDGGVISEFGNCKGDVFDAHIRPMMTRGGWIDIEGVPEGRNHYYELASLVRESAAAAERGDTPKLAGSALHHWTTEDVLHLWLGKEAAARELAEARATLDPLIFSQEYRAEFVSFEGRAYYGFGDWNKAPAGRARYVPGLPLALCFDFNRSPGVCLYVQEQPLELHPWLPNPNRRKGTLTCAVGEVFISRGSNTRVVCQRVVADWIGVHQGEVLLYGDPAGGAKTAAAVDGSDWDLVKEGLKALGQRCGPVRDRVASSAPLVRVRVNTVNARMRAADESVGFVVDPQRCPMLVRDLEGVEADSNGDIVKEQGGPLTHISDAMGYYLDEVHPCGSPVLRVDH